MPAKIFWCNPNFVHSLMSVDCTADAASVEFIGASTFLRLASGSAPSFRNVGRIYCILLTIGSAFLFRDFFFFFGFSLAGSTSSSETDISSTEHSCSFFLKSFMKELYSFGSARSNSSILQFHEFTLLFCQQTP